MFVRNLIISEAKYKIGTIHKKYTTSSYSDRHGAIVSHYYFFDVFYLSGESTKVKKMEVSYESYNEFKINDKILVK